MTTSVRSFALALLLTAVAGCNCETAAPRFTTQPADVSIEIGQPATFTVAAIGDAPLSYQWQRNQADIAGATAASYTVTSAALRDSGAKFRAIAKNPEGVATSNEARLTVTESSAMASITLQPASATAAPGATATFTLAATCAAGTLSIQWQRSTSAGGWSAIAGATNATYSVSASAADNGVQFRAVVSCSGVASATSSPATLTVIAPTTVSTSPLLVTGLRDHADISAVAGITQGPADAGFTFITTNRIKRLSADLSTITALAGGSAPAGSVDGPAATARFRAPSAIAQDPAGNFYVSDTGNHTIRKISTSGEVTTLAGAAGMAGFADASGSTARFSSPMGIAFGPDGDVYVADTDNHRIRRITASGAVTTYAGSTRGFAEGDALTAAQFSLPRGLAVGAGGELFVADYGNMRVRKITRAGSAAGVVQTLAGNGMAPGNVFEGTGSAVAVPFPSTVVVRGNTVAFADELGLLRQIDLGTNQVSMVAGTVTLGPLGYADGPRGKGFLRNVRGVVATASGFLVADTDSLRTVDASGTISTIASSAQETGSTPDGIGTLPQLPIFMGPNTRQALTTDPSGNVVIADFQTRLVRRIAPSGAVTSVAGFPSANAEKAIDGRANEAIFVSLGPIGTNSAGVIFITDHYGVRSIATDGTVSFLAGSTTETGWSNGAGTMARFFELRALAVGPSGDVFVSDSNAIRKITPAGSVSTYAGMSGQFGDLDGPAGTARFGSVRAMAFGPDGTLYALDGTTIRTVSADGMMVSRLPINDAAEGLAAGADGTLFYGAAAGLTSRNPSGMLTTLVPKGSETTYGTSPAFLAVFGVTVLGPKQLVVQANNSLLVKVTLP